MRELLPVERVTCVKCGADPREPCVTQSGDPAGKSHSARYDAIHSIPDAVLRAQALRCVVHADCREAQCAGHWRLPRVCLTRRIRRDLDPGRTFRRLSAMWFHTSCYERARPMTGPGSARVDVSSLAWLVRAFQ